MKFLVFEVWGDYAHFKRFYTTSSPLTFSIPPRTVVIGLVSAIVGIDKNEYLKVMTTDKANISLKLLNPVKKMMLSTNLINTKDNYWSLVKSKNHEPHTQVKVELLKNPRYKIYFSHADNEIYYKFKKSLEEHKSFYTPYLGISQLIADFKFVGEYEGEEMAMNNLEEISSVIALSNLESLDLSQKDSDIKYFKERLPIEMIVKDGYQRVVTKYDDVVYEINGSNIKAKLKKAILLSNGDIISILR
ncbi:MAG: type I-B CRISPR-associated protein Cas5b [Elusimicrobiales bacterium]|nr:type I-B CRISPR-associated protein Cas5b [Elusimicrobiales bacterium]